MKENKEINTEEVILLAAEEVFLEKGYALAKTTEIARRAGVNHAMLHYYFRTKENLFNMVFERKISLLATSFLSIVNGDEPFLDKIAKGIETHFDFIAANPKLPFLVLNEFLTNQERLDNYETFFAPHLAGIAANVIGGLKSEVEAEIKKGNIAVIDPFDLLVNIITLNVFAFVGSPIIKRIGNMNDVEFNKYLEHRKKENVEVIMKRLKP